MRKRYTDNTKRPKPKENQRGIIKIYAFCQKIQQMTSGPGERCWCYVSIYENAPKNCRIFPLKVATTLLSGSRRILKETTETVGPFGTMPQEPWHPGIGTKLDCVIQLNCGEVRTHASYKTTRTWENFNNRGTKMILLSDKLWLIAHNSKSFANGTGVSQ